MTELTLLEEIHLKFLHSQIMGNDMPNADRWNFILEGIPEIAKTKLYDNHNDLFKTAYDNCNDLKQLGSFIELADLKSDFYLYLTTQGVNLLHVNSYESMAATYWMAKLSDKYVAMEEDKDLLHHWIN